MRESSPRFSRPFLFAIALIGTLVLSLLVANSRVNRARSFRGPWCIANLRVIAGAKEQWALEHGIAELSAIDPAAVAGYVRGGVMPHCPKGGTYRYNVTGVPPQCSHLGHFMEGPDSCASNVRILNDALELWVAKNPARNASNILGAEVRRFFKEAGLRPECPMGGAYSFEPEHGTMKCDGAHGSLAKGAE